MIRFLSAFAVAQLVEPIIIIWKNLLIRSNTTKLYFKKENKMTRVHREVKMKRVCVISFLLLFLLNSSWLFAAPYIVKDGKAETDAGKTPLKVLFIGNSQLRKANVPIIMEQLSESAPADYPRIAAGQAVMSGGDLKQQWDAGLGLDEQTSRGKIVAEKWDYVVIQAYYKAGYNDRYKKSFETYATMFFRTIRKSGAKPILFATANASGYGGRVKSNPSYFTFPGSFEKLNDVQIALGKKRGIPIAAAGYAWLKYLGPTPTKEQILDLYDKDMAHPGAKGSYIYACLLYAVVTGKSPVGLTADIKVPKGKRITLQKDEAARMQKAAWEQYQESKPLFSGHEESKQGLELLTVEILGKARDESAVPGKFTPEMESCEKRINAFGKDLRERVVESLADMTPNLMGDAWCCLVDAAVGDDPAARQASLRKLIISVPTGEINKMLDRIDLAMRMRKLTRKNQWKELVESSKDVDFSNWPRCEALGALRMRATANFNLKNGHESEVDLKKAIALTPGQGNNASDYYNLACNYEQNLKDDERAFDAYLKSVYISNDMNKMTIASVLQACKILSVQKRNVGALNILGRVDFNKASPPSRLRLYFAYMHMLVALNRKADAIAKGKKFLQFQKITVKEKEAIENLIREIEGGTAPPQSR